MGFWEWALALFAVVVLLSIADALSKIRKLLKRADHNIDKHVNRPL